MSLVAYESSGDESDNGDEREEKQGQATPVLGPKLPGQGGPKLPESELQGGAAIKESDNLQTDENVKETSTEFDIVDDEWNLNPTQTNRTEEEIEPPNRGSIFSFLPAPKKGSNSFIVEETDDIPTATKTLGVDIPRNETEDSVENPNEESDENKQRVAGSRSIKLALPKPTKSVTASGKQRVKIALPSLPDAGSDSDDEGKESAEKKKKRLQGKSKSSLLGRLPQPKYSASTSKAPLPKTTERKASLLVPYTLTKKKEEEKSDKKTKQISENDSESDEEQPSVSFFSFGSKEETSNKLESNTKKENQIKGNVPVDKPLAGPSFSSKSTANARNSSEFSRTKTHTHTETSTIPKAIIENTRTELSNKDKKPDIKTNLSSSSRMNIPSPKLPTREPDVSIIGTSSPESVTGPYESSDVTGPYLSDTVTGPYNMEPVTGSYCSQSVTGPYMSADVTGPYTDVNSGAYSGSTVGTYLDANVQNAYDTSQHMSGAYLNPEPTAYDQYHQYGSYSHANQGIEVAESIDADQLRRLQGKRERAIQEVDFIDIHGENMKLDSSSVLKNVTDDAPIRPKMSKKDMPSSQQRKKHQITYLAFQAKEREDELRKSWAASAHSKRQTQQKYGF